MRRRLCRFAFTIVAGLILVAGAAATPALAVAAQDLSLTKASDAGQSHQATIRVAPSALRLVVAAGQQVERTVTLTNRGTAAVTWHTADGTQTAPASTAGTVLTSWEPGVAIAYGIGVERDNIWVSDTDLLRNDSFTVDGARRDEGWPTPWANVFPGPADMAYVPSRGLMCQVKVGGDNGVYCWNPRTGDIVTTIIGEFPWSTVPQRGLAYRPDDDTFYIGGWDQGIIYHIEGLGSPNPGRVISQCTPADPAISGLGWSPGLRLLWVAIQSTDNLIYAVNPDTCAPLRTLTPPNAEQFRGGGLDVDTQGNLWVVSAGQIQPTPSGTVYLITSGLPGVRDAAWLSTTPQTGVLAGGGSQQLTVRVDATGLSPGRYHATLYVINTSARRPLVTVSVRVRVTTSHH
jgi:WD40 repeat protein